MSVDKKHIDTLVDTLGSAFAFYRTPQGHDYWAEVRENLRAIQSRGCEEDRREGDRRKVLSCRHERRTWSGDRRQS